MSGHNLCVDQEHEIFYIVFENWNLKNFATALFRPKLAHVQYV
jgi:hypothetical protein